MSVLFYLLGSNSRSTGSLALAGHRRCSSLNRTVVLCENKWSVIYISFSCSLSFFYIEFDFVLRLLFQPFNLYIYIYLAMTEFLCILHSMA